MTFARYVSSQDVGIYQFFDFAILWVFSVLVDGRSGSRGGVHWGGSMSIEAGAVVTRPVFGHRTDSDQARSATLRRRLSIVAVLAGCFLLFMLVRLSTHYLVNSDENFEYKEQAFRLLHGFGTSYWTYELGIRSWIFPSLLAGAMRAGALFGDTVTERVFAQGLVALTTLIPVWCAITWTNWVYGVRHSLLAGIVVASWFEIPYWGTVALTEVIAGNLFCLGLHQAFLFRRLGRRRDLIALGALLAVVFCLRFQFALFELVVAVLVCRRDLRRWLTVIAGASGVLALSGLFDWMTLGLPFQSIWLNLWANSLIPTSAYGLKPWPFYHLTDIELHYWAFAAIPLLVGATIGFRHYPFLGIVASAIWIFHSLLSNQQLRFVYLAILLIVIAASIGIVGLTLAVERRLPQGWAKIAAPTALALWFAASAERAVAGPFAANWVHRSGYLAAADYVHQHPEVCGLAMFAGSGHVVGLSYIGRNIPFYTSLEPRKLDAYRSYVNAGVWPKNVKPAAGFKRVACWNDGYHEFATQTPEEPICLAIRSGHCDSNAPSEYVAWPAPAIALNRFATKPWHAE